MMFIVLFLVTRQAELVSKCEGTQAWRILMHGFALAGLEWNYNKFP